jgi:RNA polymerase sigma-70 factor, ECF subfamily
MSDEEIVKLVQKGSIEEYGMIVSRYEKPLFRYIRRMINQGDEEVQDLAQEVFIRAYENIRGFSIEKKFSSWIYRIAHNICVDYFKRKRVRDEVLESDDETFGSNDQLIEELEIEKEEKKRVIEVVEKLEIKYREVIWLYYFEEKSYEEMADILRTTTSNIGVLLSRGKDKLRNMIYEI